MGGEEFEAFFAFGGGDLGPDAGEAGQGADGAINDWGVGSDE